MSHVLTLVVDRDGTTLTDAIIARVRDAIQGGPPELLSPGEAADIPCRTPPDPALLAEAIGAAPVDTITTPRRNRRKGLLIADMDSTIVTTETLDEIAAYAGLKDEIAAITRRSMNGEVDFSPCCKRPASASPTTPNRSSPPLRAHRCATPICALFCSRKAIGRRSSWAWTDTSRVLDGCTLFRKRCGWVRTSGTWHEKARKGLRRPKRKRALEWHSCWRLKSRPSVENPRSRRFAGEAQNHKGPLPGSCGPAFDSLRRKQESRYQLADVDPAASTNAIPKGASPLAAGG